MSPNAQHVSLETLTAEWERVQDTLPDNLALRMRRALSWLERAEKDKDDDDATFIFYWIAFNAAYAKDWSRRARDPEMGERDRFADYFDIVLSLDTEHTIEDAIWKRFSQSIRVLLNNKFVYQPFWYHHAGLGHDDWERTFERRWEEALDALGNRDTKVVLSRLFERLYTLRNQLMHGGATWRGSVNRAQVRDGARIMAFLVPLFVSLMMSHPEIDDWGPPDYPVVK